MRRKGRLGYSDDQPFDLADVMGKLVREKQLAAYEVKERFYEIGSPAGLEELEMLFASGTKFHP
jgi:NDP-sugar pyrophosphorylase family protein